jgi:tol-pal system protein YbgF
MDPALMDPAAVSVPSYPGFMPGVEQEGRSIAPMSMKPAQGLDTPYFPSYNPVPGYGDMAGTMYPYPPQSAQPYPSYPSEMPPMYQNPYQPSYQDPYQSPYQDPYQQPSWYPPAPDMGYPSQPYQPYPQYGQPYQPYPQYGQPYQPYPQYGSADEIYNQAMQAYRSQDYWTAMSKFREVATLYPQSDLADNAYYWMGEVHYAWKNFPAAIQSYQTVVYSYPGGNKVPDALLKMGYAYAEIRQYSVARSILNDVASRFSDNSRIRNLAIKKLNELNNLY